MCLLDYQFPLKARPTDAGLGEVDLLGATDEGRLVVIELKVRQKNGSLGDTPLFAAMEGLRHAAVVHANDRAIAAEASDGFAIDVSEEPPIAQILAPEDWWRGWRDMARSTRAATGQWEPEFLDLAAELKSRLGIVIECLQGITLADVTWYAHGPSLGKTPPMRRDCLDGALAPAPTTPRGPAVPVFDSTVYDTDLLRHLWGRPTSFRRARWRQPNWSAPSPSGRIRIEFRPCSTESGQGLRNRLLHSERDASSVVQQLQELASAGPERVRCAWLLWSSRLARRRHRRVRTTGFS